MANSLNDDFQAESDAFTLVSAKEIEQDNGRLIAAKSFAEQKAEEFNQMAKALPQGKTKVVNNSVQNSKMEPK